MISGKRAFTFVELLIVVAVLAILAGVVYPIYTSARERGRQTACLNNLKQISILLQQYAQDNDGKYPGATYFYGSDESISEGLHRGFPSGLKDRHILWCPSGVQPRPGLFSGHDANGDIIFTNYAYNAELVNDLSGRGDIGREETAAPTDSWILVFDGAYGPGQGRSVDKASCPAQVDLPLFPTIHNKGGNYLFADGHSNWMIPETAVSIQCRTASMLPQNRPR